MLAFRAEGTNHPLPSPDLHRLHPGGREPLPGAAPLHPGAGAAILQPPHGRTPATCLCHRQQLLLQHEEEQKGPVLRYQVGSGSPRSWESDGPGTTLTI